MKKLTTKILGITAGIAMVVGVGAGIALSNNQKPTQLNAVTATTTYTMSDAISSSYGKYENTNFIVTLGGGGSTVGVNDNATNWGKFNLSNYSKYAVSPVTTSDYALAVVMKISTADVTSMTFAYTAGTNCNKGHIYAIYSSNNTTFSQLTITSGTAQNASLSTTSGSFTFNFAQCSGYFGILIVKDASLDVNKNLKYTNATLTLSYETAGYTVTYDANGGTGTMTDENSPYSPSDTVTVLANGFTRSDYSFDHWTTAPNGSGESYDPGDTFDISENTTLYAQWAIVKYNPTDVDNKITWNLTKATYETMESDSASWVSSKASVFASKASAGSNTNYYCPPAQSSTRFPANSEMTISPEDGYKIDSIVFTATTENYANALAGSTWDNATALASSTTVTVTPETKHNDVEVTIGGTVGLSQVVVNYSEYNALASIAISGTYPTEFTQGDVFSHEGMVVTATYDDDSDADVTASATWSGYNLASTGSQTVTVSYTEDGVEKTTTYGITVNAPLTPYVVPEIDSVEGFSGQSHILSFDYGNLTGTLSAVSNNEGVVEVSSFSYSAGEGTVTLGFVAAGSTTIEFFDGASTLGVTVSVSVTTSTVAITGLATRDSVQLASTLDLGSTISVVATGSCSSDLTWTSSNGDIATVDEDGVVTGVAQGTANITVKADDYPSATMTCAVTVAHKKTIDFTTGYNVTKPASTQEDLSNVEISDYELNILNCHNNATKYEYMMFATKDLGTNNLISNKTPTPGEISKIVFRIREGSAAGATYKATLSDSEVTSKVTSSTYSRTGAGDLVVTADPNDDLRYFGISCSTSSANGQLESIDIYYREPTTKELISEIDTLASLSYSNYTKVSENNYTFTDLCIRFGGFVSQDLWDGLDNIQGYGVILSNGNDEIEDLYNAAKDEGDTVEEALAEFCDGTNIKKFYSALTQSKTHPAEATTTQKEYMGVDTGDTYYIWTLGKGVSNENLTTVYNVVAYIIFDNDIVFLNSAKESSKTLASALIAAGAYEEDAFGGSLKYLADLSVLP